MLSGTAEPHLIYPFKAPTPVVVGAAPKMEGVTLFGAKVVEGRPKVEAEAVVAKRAAIKNAFENPAKTSRLPAERREVLAGREARKDAHELVERFKLKAEGEATVAGADKSIREWLDADVKQSYGAKFSAAFESVGVETMSDLDYLDGALTAELDMELRAAGAKSLHLKLLNQAIGIAPLVNSPPQRLGAMAA